MQETIRRTTEAIFHPSTEAPICVTSPDKAKKGPETMKCLEWHGTRDVRVGSQPKPHVTDEGDAVIRITTTTICGSDLHLYANLIPGIKPLISGDILGHEGVGVIEEIGGQVNNFKKGDRVIVSAVIACGNCTFCNRKEFSACDCVNPSKKVEQLYGQRLGALFGYTHFMGGYPGTQAEYVRVPLADLNLLKLPDTVTDEIGLLLSDVACTGWHGCELAEIKEGQTVAVWGCGPIGLMIQKWSKFRGAKKVIGIDSVPYRLEMAKKIGNADEVINYDKENVHERIQELIPGGPDACIDAAGYRFPKSLLHKFQSFLKLETDALDIVNEAVMAVRKCGKIALIGDYFGYGNQFPIGAFMEKGLTMRGGQVFVQRYWKELLEYIQSGKVDLSGFITTHMPFEKISQAYNDFYNQEEGIVKIALKVS